MSISYRCYENELIITGATHPWLAFRAAMTPPKLNAVGWV